MALRGRQPVQLGGLDNVLRDAAALLIAEAELELRVGNALIEPAAVGAVEVYQPLESCEVDCDELIISRAASALMIRGVNHPAVDVPNVGRSSTSERRAMIARPH
jgi:hypothetical protein